MQRLQIPRLRIPHRHPAAATAVLAIATLAAAPDARAQEGTVSAFSAWEASGEFYQTGPSEATFVGALSGVLYVEGDDSSLEAGMMTCPTRLRVDMEDWSQTASADCVILTVDGERIYAEFECTGAYREGCKGDFTLTGGTGTREGITGGGPIDFGSAMPALVAVPGNMVTTQAIGLARWPSLTYRLP